jgi:biopolymer transport protein ExbD
MRIRSPLPHKKTRIEIIPLIDIMFFLLASFMMVSLQMQKVQTVRASLPTATLKDKKEVSEMVNVKVDQFGKVLVDKQEMTTLDFYRMLTNKVAGNTNLPVYISGHKQAKHASMIYVLDLVKRAGISKVAFAVSATD